MGGAGLQNRLSDGLPASVDATHDTPIAPSRPPRPLPECPGTRPDGPRGLQGGSRRPPGSRKSLIYIGFFIHFLHLRHEAAKRPPEGSKRPPGPPPRPPRRAQDPPKTGPGPLQDSPDGPRIHPRRAQEPTKQGQDPHQTVPGFHRRTQDPPGLPPRGGQDPPGPPRAPQNH